MPETKNKSLEEIEEFWKSSSQRKIVPVTVPSEILELPARGINEMWVVARS